MILIISNVGDQSTTEVIDWCIHFQKDYFLITEHMLITEVELVVDEEYAIVKFNNNSELDTRKISAFWYRRQTLYFVLNFADCVDNITVRSHLESEWKVLTDYLFSLFQKKERFSNYFISDVNKLRVLETANRLGIKTPRTIVTSNYSFVPKVLEGDYINKTIHNVLAYGEKNVLYVNRTISKNQMKIPKSPFFPSLFQPEINKKYEVRTFFLNGQFSSMAIFSQNDPQTKTDFRAYNYTHPNRYVPYELPDRVKKKMVELMKIIGLKCGSIDFLVDQSDELLFLEVNPVGQFGMVSSINNDPLEKMICQELI